MKNGKQILSIIAISLLVLLYLVTLISSLLVTPYSNALFQASVYCTIIIPIMAYCMMLFYKVMKKKNKDDNEL
ncbi:hypothetical protein [Anaeromicropila herbilytica]|uniref:Uncharacterized protein n=1 Tax=Anaeromicropila herbilytica TaxID=2785025 RepID=A0A7R7ICL1_9FIRM|nr:hypothetical protein [Anaeromicropila herbilytica]BCN30049.1 hypothetical protein bsdtb5_13440 [Anaeromicropila herbilytica]